MVMELFIASWSEKISGFFFVFMQTYQDTFSRCYGCCHLSLKRYITLDCQDNIVMWYMPYFLYLVTDEEITFQARRIWFLGMAYSDCFDVVQRSSINT